MTEEEHALLSYEQLDNFVVEIECPLSDMVRQFRTSSWPTAFRLIT